MWSSERINKAAQSKGQSRALNLESLAPKAPPCCSILGRYANQFPVGLVSPWVIAYTLLADFFLEKILHLNLFLQVVET